MSDDDTSRPDSDDDEPERAPLSDLAAEVEQRHAEADVEAEESDLFETVDVGEVEVEDVWEELQAEEEALETERVGAGAEGEHVGRASATDEREEWLVPKREFCQRCEFFTAPPDTACTHEGTDIVEVEDSEHFRVRGCPMVGEDRLRGLAEEPE